MNNSSPIKQASLPWITVTLALVAVGIYLLEGSPRGLMYEPGSLSGFGLLRLFTCHLVHWSSDHLFWDVATFVLLGAWCESIDRRAYGVFLCLAAIIVPPVAFALTPNISHYAGFSGLDMGQAAFGVCYLIGRMFREGRRTRALLLCLLAAGIGAKLIYEFGFDRTFFVNNSDRVFVPVPAAHVVGVLVGVFTGVLGHLFAQRRTMPGSQNGINLSHAQFTTQIPPGDQLENSSAAGFARALPLGTRP